MKRQQAGLLDSPDLQPENMLKTNIEKNKFFSGNLILLSPE
jgi:hypothetical protein